MNGSRCIYAYLDDKDRSKILFQGSVKEVAEYSGKAVRTIYKDATVYKTHPEKSRFMKVGEKRIRVDKKPKRPYNKNKLYMIVTQDDLELPLFVGTIDEVAEFAGTTRNAIYSSISHAKGKENCHNRFRRVDDDPEDKAM